MNKDEILKSILHPKDQIHAYQLGSLIQGRSHEVEAQSEIEDLFRCKTPHQKTSFLDCGHDTHIFERF